MLIIFELSWCDFMATGIVFGREGAAEGPAEEDLTLLCEITTEFW